MYTNFPILIMKKWRDGEKFSLQLLQKSIR